MNSGRWRITRLSSQAVCAALGLCILPWVLLARPAPAATLFGLVDTGELFVSADQGASWTARSTLPVRDAVGLVAGASVTELFLASRSGTIYRSDDAGVGWTAVGTVSTSDVVDLVVQRDLSVLVLTSAGTLYQSVDAGASFSALATLTAPNFVSLDAAFGNLYALTRTGEAWESVDGGTSWAPVGAIAASNAVELRSPGDLIALTETGEVFSSPDLGRTWSAVAALSQVHMSALAQDVKTLFAATREGEVARSLDAVTWSWRGVINQLSVIALATDTPATTAVADGRRSVGFWLGSPAPNPRVGGGESAFAFRLPETGTVVLEIFDVGGRLVDRRAPEVFTAGDHRVRWNPAVRAPGLYFARIAAGSRLSAVARWVVVE